MLASHRDQENLVHSHQVSTKQQPKTPGARYPKTPLRPGQYDENAPTAFTGKAGLGGAKAGGNDKIMMTKGNGNRQGLATPMEQRNRAPLGAKTTNAKARTGQNTGVKGMVKEIEKTQLKKQPTAQKPKPKSSVRIAVKGDNDVSEEDDDEEPEYAPPRPKDLPYESDILPPGGLSLEGLKKENLFRGYYEHFINPVDENGVSRRDRQFAEEMKALLRKAEEKNQKDLEDVDWNVADARESGMLIRKTPDAPEVAEAKMARKIRGNPLQRQPSTATARKAASTLSAPIDTQKKTVARPTSSTTATRRPLSTLIAGQRTSKAVQQRSKTPTVTGGTAEVASRTTLGYNRGKSASGMIHPHGQTPSSLSGRTTRTPVLRDDEQPDLTITPARLRQSTTTGGLPQTDKTRPQFASIFDQSDDEDLAPLAGPSIPEDDDEEDFELKLDA